MPPLVSDYTTIVGYNETIHFGDAEHALAVWEEEFDAGGRWDEGDAWLFVEFGGLTAEPAHVEINGERVGRLKPLHHEDARHTQMIDLRADDLADRDNEIQIHAPEHPEPGWGAYDDFHIENMVLFYHQHLD